MRGSNQIILRARTLLPVTQPPIANGAVLISRNRIRAVGRWPDLRTSASAKVFDLGEVTLLPGLVNAHCHLDYTDMVGMLPPPRTFTDWIHLMISAKAQWDYSDYARSWLNGARQLLRTGTTTVGDIETVPDLLPEVWDATPLRVVTFIEMTGVRSRREPKTVLREALEEIRRLTHTRCRAALSPHAPYSTTPGLLRLAAEVARKRRWPLCTHLAESTEEFEMFRQARGRMFDWLKRNDRDMSDCGHGSPVQHLARNGVLGRNLLAVHVNLLARGDAALLGRQRAHVVHCPRSHAYFCHPRFQRRRLVNAGVSLCLGTDSLATVRKSGSRNPELDLFEEMRALAASDPGLAPAEIVQMATVNGAAALGLAGQVGELKAKTLADLIAIPARSDTADAHAAVLAHSGPVSASMIDGQWIIPPD